MTICGGGDWRGGRCIGGKKEGAGIAVKWLDRLSEGLVWVNMYNVMRMWGLEGERGGIAVS